jgi:anti-anti-sigma regulatory factor
LLLDLTGLSFCDARGLSAFVRMANDAHAARCGCGLIAPKPLVASVLRITGLATRRPVFATIEQARQRLTTLAATRTPVSMAASGCRPGPIPHPAVARP